MKDSIVDRKVAASNVIHVSNWSASAHRGTRAARDGFATKVQPGRHPASDIKDFFDAAQSRVTGGGLLQFILSGLQALGLLVDAIKMLNRLDASSPCDENTAPVQAFVEQSQRIIAQITACHDEASIDSLLEHLERDAWGAHGSKRVQLALEEVRSAARTAKYKVTQAALNLSEANAKAVEATYQRELTSFKADYEALTALEQSKQQVRFEQEMAKLQEGFKQEVLRAQEEVLRHTKMVSQQKDLLEGAQRCVASAKSAAEQAAVSANASMPSATSKMASVSPNSRPAPTRRGTSANGIDTGQAVVFLGLATRAMAALRGASDRQDVQHILQQHDRNVELDKMHAHTREACLTLLWQEIERGGDLTRFTAQLFGA